MDDEFGVDGVRRWASVSFFGSFVLVLALTRGAVQGLGEVSRMCRTQDGTIWIEFRDKRVAESVRLERGCCCAYLTLLVGRYAVYRPKCKSRV